MLKRMWNKGNTPPLLVGMQTCANTLEIHMVVSQKIGNQFTSGPSNTTLGHILKVCSTILQGHLLNYIYSSIICNSQNWKQPRCLSTKEWTKKMRYIYTTEYYSEV